MIKSYWIFWGGIVLLMAFNSWASYEKIKSNNVLVGELKAFRLVLETVGKSE